MASTLDVPERQRHPAGLYVLFTTEMWERFSFYGMRALLTLYLVKVFMYSDDAAQQAYGWYNSLCYLTPLFGGYLADQFLGQRRSVVIGAILMAAGQFTLASQGLFGLTGQPMLLTGLGLLIVGNGFFKPNISSMVGGLYPEGDGRKDSAYTIFYMGINLGAFLAPLICGALGERKIALADGTELYQFHWGFLAAGIGMLLGLTTFLSFQHHLGEAGLPPKRGEARVLEPLTAADFGRIAVIVILTAFSISFWAGFEQAGSSMTLFTDRKIDRTLTLPASLDGPAASIGLQRVAPEAAGAAPAADGAASGPTVWSYPTSWFQSVNPLFILALAPLMSLLWVRIDRSRYAISSVAKLGIGLILLGLGFLLMWTADGRVVTGVKGEVTQKVAVWWIIGVYLLHTVGELCLSPIGLSLVNKLSPVRLASIMMAVWFLSSSIAHAVGGQLGGLADRYQFNLWQFLAWFAIGSGAVLLVLTPLLRRLSGGRV